MTSQLSLPINAAPKIRPDDSRLICNILRGRGWLTARQIGDHWEFIAAHPGQAAGTRERFIRAVASACPMILSYPGSPGYKHKLDATDEEKETARNKLKHQAGEMLARAEQI